MDANVDRILKSKRKELGLSVREVLEALERQGVRIAAKTLYGWEAGSRQPDAESFLALCRVYGIDSLEGIEKAPTLSEEAIRLARDYDRLDEHGRRALRGLANEELARLREAEQTEETGELLYIRHYLTAAAAGYAAPIEGEDYELIPKVKGVPAKADFCIDIDGDSMEPYIHDRQRVYVQRDTELREFDVGIFFVDGDVYCKQWCQDHVGNLYLLSANPKREDANILIRRDSVRNVVCFGKVLLPKKLPRPVYR